jgi:diguanylate cyclase (GGDEF)-like protein/PAS domain S-box-containing protein
VQPFGLEALRRLQALLVGIHAVDGVTETLDAVTEGVCELLGFEVAAISTVQPDGWYECVAVAGNQDARAQALGSRRPPSELALERELGQLWGTLVFVDASVSRTSDLGPNAWVSDEEPTEGHNAWHPEDLLYAPLLARDGQMLGTLCVDMPADRLRPGPVQCQLLEMFAAHASIAIETSRSLERVRSSEITMRLAFEGAGNPMALVSLDPAERGRFLRANPALCRLLGRTEEELQTLTVRDVMHPAELDRHTADVDRLVNKELDGYVRERRYIRADGEVVWVELVVTMLDEVHGQQPYAMALMRDVTAQRRAEAELERRAMQDPLTDLPNRRALNERLQASVQLARSMGPGAVLFCDLDGFKAVNDAYGHAAGDQVLLAVADRLRRLVRGTDAVYRIGGDEFVVVADGMPATICAGLAKRIAASVGEPIALDDTSVRVQCSVGTAVLLPGAGDGGSALDEADRAMYAVKTSDTSVVRSS